MRLVTPERPEEIEFMGNYSRHMTAQGEDPVAPAGFFTLSSWILCELNIAN
jgi:hypothetical protein